MTTNDLTTPVGLDKADKPARRWRVPLLPVAGALVGLPLGLLVLWIVFVRDPLGGEPVAIVEIEAAPVTPAIEPGSDALVEGPPSEVAGPQAASEVEEASGVKVIRPGDGAAPSAVIIRAPDSSETIALVAPSEALAEKGREGLLPKIAADGRRPLDVYARPVVVPPALAGKADVPRIAIIVGGLGISRAATAAAIDRLPSEITLGFAPYGENLDAVVAGARAQGHEAMLQAPMEPFDYPDNDPGPQTLLADATPEKNLDRLRWQMSRFSGYVGIINYMGARFTSSEPALATVLREIAGRGLLFADDGTSPRSLAPTVAKAADLPFLRADVVIDADPSPRAVEEALAELERIARDRGSAFGVATALPVSVDRLAAWAASLAERGILLVPVSALARG